MYTLSLEWDLAGHNPCWKEIPNDSKYEHLLSYIFGLHTHACTYTGNKIAFADCLPGHHVRRCTLAHESCVWVCVWKSSAVCSDEVDQNISYSMVLLYVGPKKYCTSSYAFHKVSSLVDSANGRYCDDDVLCIFLLLYSSSQIDWFYFFYLNFFLNNQL